MLAMHHMDMRRFGGLKDKMPATYWLFLIGALGLAGIPPFSGFFSKDEVLAMTFGKYLDGDGVYWLVIWIAGVATAGLTAFYTFRAFALTFHGEPRGPKAEHAHAHDPGGRILGPLAILAALAAFGGFLNVSPLFGGHAGFFHFLAPVLGEVPHGGHSGAAWFAVAVTTGLGVLCAYSAFWIYTRRPDLPARVVERPGLGGLYRLASQKYRIDELYRVVFVEPIVEGARSLWRGIDVGVIDNTVNGVASVARSTAAFVRRSQAGPLGQYTFYLAGGAIAVVLLVIFGGP
jgi:NADH-quinone oxidoreductase subunit L